VRRALHSIFVPNASEGEDFVTALVELYHRLHRPSQCQLQFCSVTSTFIMTCLESQLQELQLIQYSLLPGESFSFVLPPEDSRIWASLLHSFNSTVTTALPSVPSPVPQVKFQVKAADARISFEVQFPERYPEDSDIVGAQVPLVSINGEGISRDEHHQWRAFVQEKLAEVQGNESE
jgi:hypothetical protein